LVLHEPIGPSDHLKLPQSLLTPLAQIAVKGPKHKAPRGAGLEAFVVAERECAELNAITLHQKLPIPLKTQVIRAFYFTNIYCELPKATLTLGTRTGTKGVNMAAEKLLSEAACKSAKAKLKIYYLSDGAGLRLRIRPDGSRSWIYRYRLDGKEMSTGLGAYPSVSLQNARAKAQEAKLEVSKGNNPSTSKRIARTEQITKGGNTFGLIASEWLAHNKADWSGTHYERNEGLLRRFLLADLGKLPIESITEPYLYTVIKKIYDKGTKVSAARTRTIASQIFSYARATHRATCNPARDMSDNPYFKNGLDPVI
jgi:hypothetical protein